MSEEQSKGKLIGFWILTVLIVFSQFAAGVMDVMKVGPAVPGLEALGFPSYVLYILGPAKLIGAIVIAIPGFKRLKEWAYAGFVIDFIAAAMCHGLNGDGPEKIAPPLVVLVILLGRYFLRPASRKLIES